MSTTNDCFRISRSDDTLHMLAASKSYSTLDLKSWSWQVALHHRKEKTTFYSREWMWQFTFLFFGLCNAPKVFKCLIQSILWDICYEACMEFLYYVIIVGQMFQKQLVNWQKMLQKIQRLHLILKFEKFQLLQKG